MVAFLSLEDGTPFALGKTPLSLRAVNNSQDERFHITVKFGSFQTAAVIDTASPFVICPPEIAESIGLDPSSALDTPNLRTSKKTYYGNLYRHSLTLLSDGEGQDYQFDSKYTGL